MAELTISTKCQHCNGDGVLPTRDSEEPVECVACMGTGKTVVHYLDVGELLDTISDMSDKINDIFEKVNE